MKKTIAILILLLLTCSCSSNIPEKAEKYLEEKYNENFILHSFIGKSIDQPYYEIFLYSESNPNDVVQVYYQNKKFQDNYYGILIHDNYQELLNSVLTEQFNQMKCYFNFTASYFDNSLISKDYFESAIIDFKYSFYSNTFVFITEDQGLTEDEFNSIIRKLQDKHLIGHLAIYKLSNEDYNSINENNYHDFLGLNYSMKATYKASY